jgi:superfamily II DNA or RNA helicase
MTFAPGEIVDCRGRSWIVQPGSTDTVLLVQPINGRIEESTGILLAIEQPTKSTFRVPDASFRSDARSARQLLLASKIANRNSPAPFRSISRVSVEPRPYQIVPMLLALRKDPVRILIADDVGVGKTIESLLIARELLDRGEIERFCVLCPPHLAEQWVRELRDKFHIEAKALLSNTIKQLEKAIPTDQSPFKAYPFLVISLDFIKQKQYVKEFREHGPELIIVDEAHAVTKSSAQTDHQRYDLIRELAAGEVETPVGPKKRHIILVTATPHTGKAGSFKRLLGLLDDELEALIPDDVSKASENVKRQLKQFFIQRGRTDLKKYLEDKEAPFPSRDHGRIHYAYSDAQIDIVAQAIATARQRAREGKSRHSVGLNLMGFLYSLASSREAARKALEGDFSTEAHEAGEEDEDEPGEGGLAGLGLEALAQRLREEPDAKVEALLRVLKEFGSTRNPIIFCHFIATSTYLHEALRAEKALKDFRIDVVHGHMTSAEREACLAEAMDDARPRILVATDCISEGVNLQKGYNAVIHYDLAWTPTKHEQREGRVDRYEQKAKRIPCVTITSRNSVIDDLMLGILTAKHAEIKRKTGVHYPSPKQVQEGLQAGLARLVFEGKVDPHELAGRGIQSMDLMGYQTRLIALPTLKAKGVIEWYEDTEPTRTSIFAHEKSVDDQRVVRCVKEIIAATATESEVKEFFLGFTAQLKGAHTDRGTHVDLDFAGLDPALRFLLPAQYRGEWRASFHAMDLEGVEYLPRTHPVIETTAQFLVDACLDPDEPEYAARRCGVTITADVARPHRLYLVRHRFNVEQTRGRTGRSVIEDIHIHADPDYASLDRNDPLLNCEVTRDPKEEAARRLLAPALQDIPFAQLRAFARERAEAIRENIASIREAANLPGGKFTIQPQGDPDIIGCYILQPGASK